MIKENNYTHVASCTREVSYSINIRKAAITPTGALPHPHNSEVYYCGWITSEIKNTDKDKKHCRFLGELIDIGGELRYRCKALDEMAEKRLEWK